MEWISTKLEERGYRHSKVGGVNETSLNAELHGIRLVVNFNNIFIYILFICIPTCETKIQQKI